MYIITLDGKRALNPGADTAKRVLDMGTGTGIWALEFGVFFDEDFLMELD
jgi:ubiquinone/menaquinone biosynthesis C-methylase UbiE